MADFDHLAARTHEPISDDCAEAEAEITRLTTQLKISMDALEFIRLQQDKGEDFPSAGVIADDALIQISVVE